ncbi:MAG: cell division protein FtsL [Cellvibrionaceae bacterium]|jgi:cell division protein FtsL
MSELVQRPSSQWQATQSACLWLIFSWVAVVASSLAVVYVSHDSRVKFNELENLRRDQSRLQVVWGQYLLEESTWAAYGRIEKLAQEKLSMQVPESRRIIQVTPGNENSGNKTNRYD